MTTFALDVFQDEHKAKGWCPLHPLPVVRELSGRVFIRNRTLLSIGELESELPADKISLLCKRINQIYYEGKMFVISSFRDDRVEALCTNYVAQLREAETAEKAIKKAAVNCSCPNILNLPAGIKNPPGSKRNTVR